MDTTEGLRDECGKSNLVSHGYHFIGAAGVTGPPPGTQP